MKSSIDVVCSIIRDQQNRILCVQRGQGSLEGKWEFAGGKVEEGETPQQACERELLEELEITVRAGEVVFTNEVQIQDKAYNLLFIEAEILSGEITLTEHSEARWVDKDRLNELDWLEGDLPMVHLLQKTTT